MSQVLFLVPGEDHEIPQQECIHPGKSEFILTQKILFLSSRRFIKTFQLVGEYKNELLCAQHLLKKLCSFFSHHKPDLQIPLICRPTPLEQFPSISRK